MNVLVLDTEVYSNSGGQNPAVKKEWAGRRVSDLVPTDCAIAVSLARGMKSVLPRAETELETDDILQVSATEEGLRLLRQRIHDNGFAAQGAA